ncbi:MAG: quinoprotein dehydrogenase-associated SoxYZ-like carrier [Ideonella sp. MAG2]|nr:MAG: quinoprotein dehydrogenase-associated SoxYZ-like carrier [Ideonella sp. MAG2]
MGSEPKGAVVKDLLFQSLAISALAVLLAAPALSATATPTKAATTAPADAFEGDPYRSLPWADMRKEFLGGGRAVFDTRVQVQGPAFAEDPMNVPISVKVDPALGPVQRMVLLVDRNPIRKVLEYQPVTALPAIAFRFKLEQASPVRAAVLTQDGLWHVGGTWVDSAGGGCTVSGATRKDGTWTQTLGEVSGRLFTSAPGNAEASISRLRVRVMHPQDTGLVGGIPAFYVNKLSVRDGKDRELARLLSFEPVSENPVFSFDFATPPDGGVFVVGSDNNGNRIASKLE